MLPACRTGGEGFALPTFEVVPSDVEGFMEELWEFQSVSRVSDLYFHCNICHADTLF